MFRYRYAISVNVRVYTNMLDMLLCHQKSEIEEVGNKIVYFLFINAFPYYDAVYLPVWYISKCIYRHRQEYIYIRPKDWYGARD